MYEIKSLKEIYNNIREKDYIILTNKIYNVTKDFSKYYPNHYFWFFNIHLKEVVNGNRDTLFIEDNDQIIGVANIINNHDLKKICTLYIIPEYRNKGIGTKLIEKVFSILKTTKPQATVTEKNLDNISLIANKYDWKIVEKIDGLYKEGLTEIIYNVEYK